MSARWLIVTPLSGRTVFAVVLAVLLVVMATVVGLLWWLGSAPTESTTVQLDVIKIGLSVGVGGGGVLALYLAWRRQHSTEETLRHQQQVAAATEVDARERRINDHYAKAIDQLDSDKAPVRLGGVYALERLAQNAPDQRQRIVDVLCACLCGPSASKGDDGVLDERVVRPAIQRVLTSHLRPGARFWPDIDLYLIGAELGEFDFRDCHVRDANFEDAIFVGPAQFDNARFAGDVRFVTSTFTTDVYFDGACFDAGVWFSGAQLKIATFTGTRFEGLVDLRGMHNDGESVHLPSLSEAIFVNGVPREVVPFLDRPDEGL